MLLFSECFQIFLFLSLFFRSLDKVSDCIAVQDLFNIEYLVEIFLQFLSSFLDVFRAFIGHSKNFLFRKRREIFNFTLYQCFMDISKLTVSHLVCPLFMWIQIPKSNIIENCIFDQCVAVYADLHIQLMIIGGLLGALLNQMFLWQIILFEDIDIVEFLFLNEIVEILEILETCTWLSYFFL